MKSCPSCGAPTGGAAACPSCGKLTATSTAVSCVEPLLSFLGGTVLAVIIYWALLPRIPSCTAFHVLDVLTIGGLVAAVAAGAYGIRLARLGKSRAGTVLIAGSIGFLLPAAPCALILVVGNC